MNHTAGPWILSSNDGAFNNPHHEDKNYAVVTDEWIVAEVCGDCGDSSEAEANARLIAAAPDLLDACYVASACFPVDDPMHATLKMVIAKAVGEKVPA